VKSSIPICIVETASDIKIKGNDIAADVMIARMPVQNTFEFRIYRALKIGFFLQI
jgi:hypothetical protein